MNWKKLLEVFNSRFEQEEERIIKLEDLTSEIIELGAVRKKKEEKWTEPKALMEHHQVGNICAVGVPQ